MTTRLPVGPNPVSLRVGYEQVLHVTVVPPHHVRRRTIYAQHLRDDSQEFTEAHADSRSYQLVSNLRFHSSPILRSVPLAPIVRPTDRSYKGPTSLVADLAKR